MNELENIHMMLNDNKTQLQNKIDTLFQNYKRRYKQEPIYASCCIKYLDDSQLADVTIKLSNDLDVMDDSLFFYCNSLNGLKSLCEFGVEDFIVTDVYELSTEIGI